MSKKYKKTRPTIPAEIKRLVIIESGHQCSVLHCNEHTYNEYHHIDGNRENNIFENLIYLCDKHHKMSHSGLIDKKYLRKYKEINSIHAKFEILEDVKIKAENLDKIEQNTVSLSFDNSDTKGIVDNIINRFFIELFSMVVFEIEGVNNTRSNTYISLSNQIFTDYLYSIHKNLKGEEIKITLSVSASIFMCIEALIFNLLSSEDKNKFFHRVRESYKLLIPDIVESDADAEKKKKLKLFKEVVADREKDITIIMDFYKKSFLVSAGIVFSNVSNLYMTCKNKEERILLSTLLSNTEFIGNFLFDNSAVKCREIIHNVLLNLSITLNGVKIGIIIGNNGKLKGIDLLNLEKWNIISIARNEDFIENCFSGVHESVFLLKKST